MNEQENWTPGEWLVALGKGGALLGEAQAWARLMKAAPLLYRELAQLVQALEPREQDGSLDIPGLATLNAARRALRIAEGEEV